LEDVLHLLISIIGIHNLPIGSCGCSATNLNQLTISNSARISNIVFPGTAHTHPTDYIYTVSIRSKSIVLKNNSERKIRLAP
jgi:hypothetical protein